MDFYERLREKYRSFKHRLTKKTLTDEIQTTSLVNLREIFKSKAFLTILMVLIIGNIVGIVFMTGLGTNPNSLGTVVLSEETQEIQPNSTIYYHVFLNASKSSVSFKTDLNVEYYLFDQPINENISLDDVKTEAIYSDNDARRLSKYLVEKTNYTLVIVTHEEKTTEFECSFKEYSIDEQEEIIYFTIGKYLVIFSNVPLLLFLIIKIVFPWIQTKNLVFWTLLSHEINLNFKLWIQRLWILVVIFLSFSNITAAPGVSVISSVPFIFVFFGTIIAAVPASSSISGELGGIADSLLSKSVQRWQYLLAKFFSHYFVVLVIYFTTFLSIIGIKVALKQFPTNLDYEQLFIGLGLIGISLVLFATFGVLFSTLFPKPLYAIIGSLVIWFFFIFMIQSNPSWDLIYSPVVVLANFDFILLNLWDVLYWKLFLVYFGIQITCISLAQIALYQKDL